MGHYRSQAPRRRHRSGNVRSQRRASRWAPAAALGHEQHRRVRRRARPVPGALGMGSLQVVRPHWVRSRSGADSVDGGSARAEKETATRRGPTATATRRTLASDGDYRRDGQGSTPNVRNGLGDEHDRSAWTGRRHASIRSQPGIAMGGAQGALLHRAGHRAGCRVTCLFLPCANSA